MSNLVNVTVALCLGGRTSSPEMLCVLVCTREKKVLLTVVESRRKAAWEFPVLSFPE